MLNVWPELFTYEILAKTLLRVAVALFFLTHGVRTLSLWGIGAFFKRFGAWGVWVARFATALQVAVGALLLVGAWTQIAALIGALLSLKLSVVARRFPTVAPHERTTYYLVAVVCVALLFLGAGAFAIDYSEI